MSPEKKKKLLTPSLRLNQKRQVHYIYLQQVSLRKPDTAKNQTWRTFALNSCILVHLLMIHLSNGAQGGNMFFFKPGFHAAYYISTMPRFDRAKTCFFWNNSLQVTIHGKVSAYSIFGVSGLRKLAHQLRMNRPFTRKGLVAKLQQDFSKY